MRLLVIVHGFPPLHQGGSEIYAHTHACALRRLYGDDILVLTRENDSTRPEYALRVERRDGLHIIWINNTFRDVYAFEGTYRNAKIHRIAARIIDQFRPDAAHVHHLTCLSTTILEALAARQVPVVFTLHDYWLRCHRGQLLDVDAQVCTGPARTGCQACVSPLTAAGTSVHASARIVSAIGRRLPVDLASRLRRTAVRLGRLVASADEATHRVEQRCHHMRTVAASVATFLAPSHYMRARFVEFGIAPDRIQVFRYGFDPGPFAAIRRTPSAVLRLGFLGSLMLSKAPHLLLEACARLPRGSVTLDLYGEYVPYHNDDGYRDRLQHLFALPNVRVHRATPHDRIPQVLADIDVLVVPSIWPENSPLVIQEAFLARVPVVASNIGGIPEFIDHGRNGLLFRANDVDDLHRTLKRFLDEPGLSASLRAQRTPVRTLDDDVQSARTLYDRYRREGAARPRPRLAAVVLNYRTPQDTLLAVKSLVASDRPVDDLIVVDNGSEDCRAALRSVEDRISYVGTETNGGFSAGMNVGIRTALERGAAAVLLVNSDVIVPPDCVGRLEHALQSTVGAGIAGPVIVARTDPGRIASLGIRYDPTSGRMRHHGFGRRLDEQDVSDMRTVDAVAGCLMLISRQVFETVGLLEEKYFFSFEDLDICLRARGAGLATILVGTAIAHHEGGRSIGAHNPRRLYFATRNHLLMARRTSRTVRRRAELYRTMSILMLNVGYAFRARGDWLPNRLRAVVRGAGDYFSGRFGRG